jgi:YHS domain-containing protein
MTSPRRSRKSGLPRTGAAFALVFLAVFAGAAGGLRAATTERVVTDRHTGFAIYGIDPVAYFTDKKPVTGRAEFEFRFAGAIWRFANEGNRAAFVADPKIYMPRFGGYDPVGVARGVTTPGYPQLWAIAKDRLYLFYTAQARAAFLADPAATIAAAEAHWAQIVQDLSE